MKKWVAKFILMHGVLELEGEVIENGVFETTGPNGGKMRCRPGEFFDTKDEALAKARELKPKKIEILKSRIEKIKKKLSNVDADKKKIVEKNLAKTEEILKKGEAMDF